ncbi:alpha/beta hydrolase, partial [Francisella philomiragia]
YDYSAAIAMSEFAGQKLAIIIDYLKQNGIKVNIMAHSLGNAVTMNTLKNVSTPVDQAICWEPAIANDSLSNSNRNEAVQDIATSYHKLDSQGKPISDIAVQQYNVSYNYAAAASKADKFTIAYSNLDEMLGPIPNIPSLFKKGEIQSMTMNEAVNRMITHVLVSVSSYYFSTAKIGTSFADTTYKLIPNILAGTINYKKYPEAQAIHEKISDKGAGLLFGMIGAISYALNSFMAQSTGPDTTGGFESIYQIANKFIYPASYFVEGNIGQKCQAFYIKWSQVYQDNKPLLATNDMDALMGEHFYQNLSLRDRLRTNSIPTIHAYHEKDTLYDIASEVIDKLYKLTNTGVADIPQQVWNNLEDSISNIFNQNPISTVWDTSMSFVGPAVNGAGSLTTTVIDFLKGADIQAAIKNIKDNKEELLAVVFTVLMQPNSKVAPAMGYSGVDTKSSFFQQNFGSKLFQTPQEIETAKLDSKYVKDYPCYYIDKDGTKHTVAYDQLTDEQKASAKSMLCVDHSAMLYPKPMFMEWVYKKTLFGELVPNAGFDFFGSYDVEKVKSQNMGTGNQSGGGDNYA